MTDEFRGAALPLSREGLNEVTDKLGVGVAEVWAVLTVETRGCGFQPDRRPIILFERHIFSKETGHQFDESNPEISNPIAGGYDEGGANQYERLDRAISLNRISALCSTSWGIGQLMGFNSTVAGYSDVSTMVNAMKESEDNQLIGMAAEIAENNLHRALRSHDWVAFARGYNGPAYAKHQYDDRLRAAFEKCGHGPLPDLLVRAAQMYLTFLGYHPGPVDGVLGRFTLSSLHCFQSKYGLSVSDQIDESTISVLKEKVENPTD